MSYSERVQSARQWHGESVPTLSHAGFDVSTSNADVSSRPSVHALVQKATTVGDIVGLIHAAGVSPSQASPETILKVDLYASLDAAVEISRPASVRACEPRRWRSVDISVSKSLSEEWGSPLHLR